MKNKKVEKGIYCIEGLWEHNNIKDKSSVFPILDLLEKNSVCQNIYHDCATTEELEFFLNKWVPKAISDKYPILYLAFHGLENCILIGKQSYSLDQLGNFLENKCSGKIIHFGSCLTLNTDRRHISRFLEQTNAIAVVGYTTEVLWMKSTVMDLLIFELLQYDKLDSKGVTIIKNKIKAEFGKLPKDLGLRFEINNKTHFPRKRK
jgi:hypothetical protein